MRALSLSALLLLSPAAVQAQDAAPPAPEPTATTPVASNEDASAETVVTSTRLDVARDAQPRALDVVTAQEMFERSSRTTPEALSEMEGVYVQKTNHGGGAPIIRGLYGQQVLLLIDGIRLNNATVRAGPNQFLNTVDPFLVSQIEVLRGPGSVLYGSDALGGVINVRTFWPRFSDELKLGGALRGMGSTADTSLQGHLRASVSAQDTAVAAGVSARDFNDLRGGARIGLQPYTAYEEWDATVKLRQRLTPGGQLLFQYQGTRQADAPRLDRSVPGDFRRFTEQYRDLIHGRYEHAQLGALHTLSLELSAQRQGDVTDRYRVARDRQDRDAAGDWTFGGRLEGSASPRLGDLGVTFTGGLDVFSDRVDAEATRIKVSDPSSVTESSVDARYPLTSHSLSSGLFARASTDPEAPLSGYLGVRAQLNRLSLPEDGRAHETFAAAANPPPIQPASVIWSPGFAGEAGAAWRPVKGLALLLNLGSGFRSPNVDDFTRYGAEGPGFLIPSRDLLPEQSFTGEVGLRYERKWLRAEAFFASTVIPGLVGNVPTSVDGQTRTPDNLPYLVRQNRESASLNAVEAVLELRPLPSLLLAANASYVTGEQSRRDLLTAGEPLIEEPLARQPPLNGTVRARWSPLGWIYGEAVLRWATAQTRISSTDRLDNRICAEAPSCVGTAGYAAVHLRAGASWNDRLSAAITLQNLFDATYRVHGSGVDEPGRSVALSLEAKL